MFTLAPSPSGACITHRKARRKRRPWWTGVPAKRGREEKGASESSAASGARGEFSL